MKKFGFIRKKAIVSFIFLFMGAAIFFLSNYGVNYKSNRVTELKDFPKDYQIELLLPVNVVKSNAYNKSRVNLLVSVPKDFCSVSPLSVVMEANMAEFIPKIDKNVSSWSEIITTHKFIGKSLKASQVIDNLKRVLSRGDLSARVLESNNNECGNYSESMLLMTYTDKGRREIVYGNYYSGPYDCSGFQYAIALNQNMTEEKAKHKIREFAKKNTDIIKF